MSEKVTIDPERRWRIEKQGYSAHPWRLLDEYGQQIYMPMVFDHPHLGRTSVSEPVSADTKSELVELCLWMLREQAKSIESFRKSEGE